MTCSVVSLSKDQIKHDLPSDRANFQICNKSTNTVWMYETVQVIVWFHSSQNSSRIIHAVSLRVFDCCQMGKCANMHLCWSQLPILFQCIHLYPYLMSYYDCSYLLLLLLLQTWSRITLLEFPFMKPSRWNVIFVLCSLLFMLIVEWLQSFQCLQDWPHIPVPYVDWYSVKIWFRQCSSLILSDKTEVRLLLVADPHLQVYHSSWYYPVEFAAITDNDW